MMDDLIIVAVFAILAAPLATTLYKALMKCFKKDTDKDVSEFGVRELREELIKALGAEILSSNESSYIVNFHGGHFWFNFGDDNKALSIVYPRFAGLKNEELSKAYIVANGINMDYFWNVYIGYTHDEELPLMADCSFIYILQGSLKGCAETLKYWLDQSFAISREFNDRMKNESDEKDSLIINMERDAMHKIHYDHYKRVETILQGCGVEDADGRLTIANLLALSRDVDFGCIEGLRVVVGDEIETCNNADEVLAFDIKKYVIEHLQHRRITLMVDFEKQILLIDLKKTDGGDEKHLHYQILVTRNSNEMNGELFVNGNVPFCFNTLLTINLTTDEEDAWEAKYMLEEMDLSYPLECLDDDGKKDYYWGLKLFNAGNYLQALPHLKRVYNKLRAPDEEDCAGVYNYACFMIGTIYMRLNMPDTAYIYLTTIVGRTDNPNCLNEFASCLSHINKANALDMLLEIESMLIEKRDKAIENDEVETFAYKQIQMTYAYTNRVIIMEMIKRRKYDKAKDIVEVMINDDFDTDFAREMLEKIEKELGDNGL